jgi:hypothetical protein
LCLTGAVVTTAGVGGEGAAGGAVRRGRFGDDEGEVLTVALGCDAAGVFTGSAGVSAGGEAGVVVAGAGGVAPDGKAAGCD